MLANTPYAEELLEKIFHYMNQLIVEKDFSRMVVLLTDLGRVLVNADRASLWYWDKKKKQYWTVAASGSGRISIPEGTGIVGAAIAGNETIVLNDPYEDERFNAQIDKETGYKTESILCMPVVSVKGQVLGAYQAINKKDGNGKSDFDEQDVKRLAMAAVYSGTLMESHLLYEESRMDPLTGLKNRRGYYEYYQDDILPALHENTGAIIMCDIDFFKKVNDTYGHNAGDAVLEHVSAVLRKQTGEKGGEAFRWGGEEFIAMLPGKTLKEAAELAEKLRTHIEKSVCDFEDDAIRITMSFGVNELDPKLSVDENVEIVDGRLYRAKEEGRNRVICQ